MTKKQLKESLDQLGVNPERYDLSGGIPIRSEGLAFVEEGENKWLVRHFERGSWYTLADCSTEDEACRRFLSYASDPFYQS